jgi:hypothetical protein
VAGSTHEITTFCTLFVRGWNDLRIEVDGRWFNMRLDGQLNKGGEYGMGRSVSGLFFMFRALKVVAPTCVN